MTTRSQFRHKSDDVRGPAAIPKLPIRMLNVRAKDGAVVYTIEGVPIPEETWVQVPVSAGIINAIKYGDLEEGEIEEETAEETAEAHQRQRRRRQPKRRGKKKD